MIFDILKLETPYYRDKTRILMSFYKNLEILSKKIFEEIRKIFSKKSKNKNYKSKNTKVN